MARLFDRTVDCLCSALAINCAQVGCCIPYLASVEYGHANSTWMKNLTEHDPDKRLRDVVLPGSHDSGSYSIGRTKPFSAVGITQNLSVMDQLNRGARYLDIRVGGSGKGKDSIYIYHGFLPGTKLVVVMEDMLRFIEENPGEFIILEIVQEYGRELTEEQRFYILNMVKKSIGEKLVTQEDRRSWFKKIGDVTLGQIAESRRNCLALLHPRIFNFTYNNLTHDEDYIADTYSLFSSPKLMRNKWHNTTSIPQLLGSNEEEMEKYHEKRDKFLNNSFVLTPGVSNSLDVVKLLVGQTSLRPISLAIQLNKDDLLDEHVREKADEPWNIVTFDFIDLFPALIDFLIGLNFSSGLSILRAAAKSGDGKPVDVSDKMQSFVKNERVVFLTDVQKDLGLNFMRGKLTVAFKFNGGGHFVHEIEFKESTDYLLSFHSHKSGGYVQLEVDEQPEGVVCCGEIFPMEDCEALKSKQNDTILEYMVDPEDSVVRFNIVVEE